MNYACSSRPLASTPEPLEARIAPAFVVASTTPPNGAFLGTAPTEIVVDFNDGILLPTLQASDLRIDGVAATGFTVLDGDTVRFTLPTDLAEGVRNVVIVEGAIQDVQGTPISRYAGQFTIDSTGPRVVSSSTEGGARVEPGALTYTVRFSEPLATGSIGTGDFTLTGTDRNATYTSNSTSFNAAGDTLTITFADLPEDRYTLRLLSGNGRFEDRAGNDLDGEAIFPLPPEGSGNGIAGGSFVVSFAVDGQTTAFPPPVAAQPAGSLVYEATTTVALSFAGDVDRFTLPLEAGQTITVLADPSGSLAPMVSLIGPSGSVVSSGSATSAGRDALIPIVTVPTTGTYSITVRDAQSSVGTVSVLVLLNSMLEGEAESYLGNNTQRNAQSLTQSFLNLGDGISRGAVRGTADLDYPREAEPNNTTSQANDAAANFTAFAGNLYHLALVGSDLGLADQDYFNIGTLGAGDVITITQSGAGSSRGTLNGGLIELYRAGRETPQLVTSDSGNGPDSDALTHRFTITATDTYYINARGFGSSAGTYQVSVQLENTGAAPLTGGATFEEVEPNETAATATNASTSWRQVQYLSRTAGTITFGDIDTYRYQFNAGDLVAVHIDSTSTLDARVALLNSAGTVIASENGTSFQPGRDSLIHAFRIPAAGTYFVQAQAASGTGTYNADVYLSAATPPPTRLSGQDFYSITLNAGQTATFVLDALTKGAVQMELQNRAGVVQAIGTTGATSADRVIHNFTAPALGTYYVRVTGEFPTPYQLVVTRGADFDTELNDTLATAQSIDGSGAVIGSLAGADFFSVEVPQAGTTLVVKTSTPGTRFTPGAGLSDVILDLYDPSGAVVATQTSTGADGANAELIFQTSATGTYTVGVRSNGAEGDYVLRVLGANSTNDAPVLIGSGAASLATIDEDALNNAGTRVADFIANAGQPLVVDPDADAMKGIAVIGVADENGTWQFTTDGGATWQPFGEVDESSARLLASDPETAIRFVPDADFNGVITNGLTFRGWDQTTGASGATANTTVNGGSTAFSVESATAGITVNAVNDAPTFTIGGGLTRPEDAGRHTVFGFASSVSAGPANEAGQALTFLVSTDNPALFSEQPAIAANGTLTYALASDAFGTAVMTVRLQDSGGGANGGANTSAPQTFAINVTPVNDAPVNTVPGAQQTAQGQALEFSRSAFAVTDRDAGNARVRVTLQASNGTVSIANAELVRFVGGDGTDDRIIVFEDSIAAINRALTGVTFLPTAGFSGTAGLQLTTNDLGNTGGGPLIDTDSVLITVAPSIFFTNSATFKDADGDVVTVTLTGGGSGEIRRLNADESDAIAIVLNGTTAASSLVITTAAGTETTVGNIIVNGSLDRLIGKTTDLSGTLDIAGGIRVLKLDDVVSGSDLRLHTDSELSIGGVRASVTFDRVADASLTSNGLALRLLKATEWLDTDGNADLITAPRIGKLKITGDQTRVVEGDFDASLLLSGKGAAKTLVKAGIAGDIGNAAAGPAVWDITGAAGLVKVRGDVIDLDIRVRDGADSIAKASAGTMDFHVVSELDVIVEGPIGQVSAGLWMNGQLRATRLASLAIEGAGDRNLSGDFGADLTLTGRAAGFALGSATVAGAVVRGVWNVAGSAGDISAREITSGWNATFGGSIESVSTRRDAAGQLTAAALGELSVGGDLLDARYSFTQRVNPNAPEAKTVGSISIGGRMDGSNIRSAGSIEEITVGALRGSRIFAGVRLGATALPDELSDFNSPASIDRFAITGIRGESGPSFAGSHVAAAAFGTVRIAGLQVENGNAPFGIAADTIAFLKVRHGAQTLRFTELAAPDTALVLEDFVVRVL